jgi:hypothetical protein
MGVALVGAISAEGIGDYVQVSGDSGTLTVQIPPDVDPRAFLYALPWLFVERRFESPAGRCLWLRAHLFLHGRFSEEMFFIADS